MIGCAPCNDSINQGELIIYLALASAPPAASSSSQAATANLPSSREGSTRWDGETACDSVTGQWCPRPDRRRWPRGAGHRRPRRTHTRTRTPTRTATSSLSGEIGGKRVLRACRHCSPISPAPPLEDPGMTTSSRPPPTCLLTPSPSPPHRPNAVAHLHMPPPPYSRAVLDGRRRGASPCMSVVSARMPRRSGGGWRAGRGEAEDRGWDEVGVSVKSESEEDEARTVARASWRGIGGGGAAVNEGGGGHRQWRRDGCFARDAEGASRRHHGGTGSERPVARRSSSQPAAPGRQRQRQREVSEGNGSFEFRWKQKQTVLGEGNTVKTTIY